MERVLEVLKPRIQKAPHFLNVAAYARVSTGKEAMLNSLYAQISYYNEMITNHAGWNFAGVYADEAVTGTKDSRKEFTRLMKDCQAGKIDMIITKSISRMARNTVILLETVRELKTLGVNVYFEEQNLYTNSGEGELMLTLLASFAQAESLSASENQKWRARKAFEEGELYGLRYFYGYTIQKGNVEINPKQSVIIKEIFNRLTNGESANSIANDLKKREVPTFLGGEWKASRVFEILRNEKYTGNALLQKTFINNHIEKKKIVNRGELPRYFAEGTHPAIIDDETYRKAQIILHGLSIHNSGRSMQKNSVFTSKIKCGNCGKNYRHITNNGKSVWNCSTYVKDGKSACAAKRIPDDILKEVSAEVLSIEEFEEGIFAERVSQIVVFNDNKLEFHFYDGQIVEAQWKDRSRAAAWTKEMRLEAAEKAKQQRRK